MAGRIAVRPVLMVTWPSIIVMRSCWLLFVCLPLWALQVSVNGPLNTTVPIDQALPADAVQVSVTIGVPADAPADLGIGVFVQDDSGRWFQSLQPETLTPGWHRLRLPIGADATLVSPTGYPAWSRHQRQRCDRFGLFFWTGQAVDLQVQIHNIDLRRKAVVADRQRQVLDLDGGSWQVECGERWQLEFRFNPMPANPFTIDDVRLLLSGPHDSTMVIPAFYLPAISLHDRGDEQLGRVAGPGGMAVRFRPAQPGTWQLQLQLGEERLELPSLTVTGLAQDIYVQRSERDPRFFSLDDDQTLWWPQTINLHAITDRRCRNHFDVSATPQRGSLSYAAYFARAQRAGIGLAEVWLSAWNLGLESRPDYTGFFGLERYNETRAAQLDVVLDAAWQHGIRLILVLNNHGQLSTRTDAEWEHNPYSQRHGGPLDNPVEWWHEPQALAAQARLRRYLLARYSDHPAVAMWKLLTEIDLTDAGWPTRHNGRRNQTLLDWHQQAAAAWRREDPYHHPIGTHWSTDYTYVDRSIAELPELDYLAIDAYHGGGRHGDGLTELLAASLHSRSRGLSRYGKPVVVTEYGGNSSAGPEPQLLAELRLAPWVALVSGHATAPMLWWAEWVDQHDHYDAYPAITRFLDGEDFRHERARSVPLQLHGNAQSVWNRAWARPGRILGYLLDRAWGKNGGSSLRTHRGLSVLISGSAKPGQMALEWWDADEGRCVSQQQWQHPGGELRLPVPDFRRHIAFKLGRVED